MDTLAAFCCENSEVLEAELQGAGREYGTITARKQNDLWREITDKINALGYDKRDVAQLKRKWGLIRSDGNLCVFMLKVRVCYISV